MQSKRRWLPRWQRIELAELCLEHGMSRRRAADLEGVTDAETIDARMVADTNQALPADEAVTSAPKRAPAALRSRGKTGQVRGPARRSERGR
jgi:hypothetical protein